ncbi:MAG: hypothetical protein V1746_00140 [bacterium]
MAHFRKATEELKLRPSSNLVRRLKIWREKTGQPSHNQLALELIEAGLNMIGQTNHYCKVDPIIQEIRERMGLRSDVAPPVEASPMRIREVTREIVREEIKALREQSKSSSSS